MVTIGKYEFARVSVLVLDYDPAREDRPAEAIVDSYKKLGQSLTAWYGSPSRKGTDAIVLANEELIAKHQADLEKAGITFFPNWRETKEYRDLLREGLRQGNEIHVMQDVGNRGGYGVWYTPKYILRRVTKDEIKIFDPNGKIDIKPR